MPALPTGLVRHHNGRFYHRRRIPEDLIQDDGKKEHIKSLKTSEYRTALQRFHIAESKLQSDWHKLRQRKADFFAARQVQAITVLNALTDDDIGRISQHVEAAALAGDEQRREDGTYDIAEILDYQSAYGDALPAIKAAVAIGDISSLGPMLQEFLFLHRYDNQLGDADFRRLAIAFGRAVIRTNEKLLRRFDGEEILTPRLAQPREQHMLSVVVQDFIDKYPAEKHAAMYKKVCAVLPMFLAVVGDKPIHTLRQTDLNRFFEIVNQLPPRWKDVARQRNLTIVQVAELELGEMAPGTFEGTYKAVMTPFIKTAKTNWQDKGFPTTLTTEMIAYTGDREDGAGRQRAFKLEELKRLFTGAEMQTFAKDKAERHKFWLPHLGLFTGARVNELCQINPMVDIQQDASSGVWYLDITEQSEAADQVVKRVKTRSSRRKVPIHSHLIEIGFLAYVADLKKQGKKLLFNGFEPRKERAATEAEKWFRTFISETGLRDETAGARIVGMHAFRSTLLNRAANLGVINAEAITGHAQNMTSLAKTQDAILGTDASSVVRRYQGELDIDVKKAIIERITFDLTLLTPVR